MKHLVVIGTALLLGAVLSCQQREHGPAPSTTSAGPAASGSVASPAAASVTAVTVPRGNAERGLALTKKYECNRCHDGTGHPAMALEKHCFSCHQDIDRGRFKAPAAKLTKWKKHVTHVLDVPSLEGTAKRFRYEWLVGFLRKPQDLRPHLAPSMPRLAISVQDARDIATYLTRDHKPGAQPALTKADPARGRRLLVAKACGTCHEFSGVKSLSSRPAADRAARQTRDNPGPRPALCAGAPDTSGLRELGADAAADQSKHVDATSGP